jgi:hypothetical protein
MEGKHVQCVGRDRWCSIKSLLRIFKENNKKVQIKLGPFRDSRAIDKSTWETTDYFYLLFNKGRPKIGQGVRKDGYRYWQMSVSGELQMSYL